MFIRKSKLQEIEEKIRQISDILKIHWVIDNKHDSYSPPTMFWQEYGANQKNILQAMIDYLQLEIEEEKAKPYSLKITKKT